MSALHHIAIFASGTGTNARAIMQHFANHMAIKVALVVTNNANAGVLNFADEFNVPTVVVSRKEMADEAYFTSVLDLYKIDFIALAGFMQLIPLYLVKKFEHRMVNIHPALLPKYGGKGMYGMYVHEAVCSARETETGITIHYVTEHYDEGAPILQKQVNVLPGETPVQVAAKVQKLEHEWYPKVIEQLLS